MDLLLNGMQPSRRTFLKTVGATTGAGALLSSASPVAAHAKPDYVWRSADSSNYSSGRNGQNIRWYVIHVAEGSYWGTISWFQNPDSNASTHYVIENDSDPELTQMVDESDIGWHAGNWDYNQHSLGIEHAGYVGSTYWTDATYRKSARLAQWAGETYGFPLEVKRFDVAPCSASSGTGGIIGHDQIPDPDNCSAGGGSGRHTDPGSTWNWGKFEGFLRRFHLDVGDGVVTDGNLNIRDSPNGNYLDTTANYSSGTVVDGPVDSGGYRWYKVDYDDSYATGWSAADWLLYSRFTHGGRVATTSALSVRDGPGTSNTQIDTAYNGEGGTVVDGAVDADGYRWFKVDYDSAATGWSAGYWLS